jgi:hypothetical protein
MNNPARTPHAVPATNVREPVELAAQLAELGRSGIDPTDVAAQVLGAIRGDELYVFTHSGASWRAELAERFAAILVAMDKAAAR